MVYWMYAVELDESTGWDAEKMMAELFSRGVETRPFFIGLHEQPALLDKGLYRNEEFPVTYNSSRQGFYLPSSMSLTDTQINFVVDQIKRYFRSIENNMLIKTSKLFSAELNKNLYPISADDYFNRTKVSTYNLSTMRLIVRENIKPISDNNDLNILDWGCGNSLWAFALFPKAFVTGVDILKNNLIYSKINAKKNASKFRGLLFDRDISKLRENTFDHAISISLIEFFK